MLNAEILNKAGIDYAAGLDRFMNDPALYEEVLSAFASENVLERAQAAFASGDYATLMKVAHEAKGSGGNAGLDSVYTSAGALVATLRGDSYTEDELTEDYRRFANAYVTARNGIKAALGK